MDALKSKGQMLDQINLGDIPRSGFDRSFNFKGCGTLGRLYPVRCDETLPGDRFQGSSTATVQFQPLAVPMMANMYTRIETFKCPSRILWDNWEKFITGGENLDDNSTPPSVPFESILRAFANQLNIMTDIPIHVGELNYKQPDGSNLLLSSKTLSVVKRDFSIWLSDVLTGIRSSAWLDTYQCRDLLQQSIDVLENLRSNLDTYFPDNLFTEDDGYPCIPVFAVRYEKLDEIKRITHNASVMHPDADGNPVYGVTTPSGDGLRSHTAVYTAADLVAKGFYSAKDNDAPFDAYTYELRSFLPELLDKMFPNVNASPYVFSTEFFAILQGIYDYFKPLFGVGSNLDAMSAGCIGMDDYVVHCYTAAYYEMYMSAGNNTAPICSWDIDNGHIGSSHVVNILPFRALYLIWYWNYRDQLLETNAFVPSTSSGVTESEIIALFLPRYRCWSKDTFTTALTNTGTGSMFVKVEDKAFGRDYTVYKPLGDVVFTENDKLQGMDNFEYTLSDGTKIQLPTRYLSGMHSVQDAKLSADNVAGFSLDMLTRAQRMQKWVQKALIYGNRPQDSLWTHWKVRSSDARLQLPEYISGESSLVRLDTITNNTTTSQSVAGDKAANAYGFFDGMNMNTYCEEHGFIISLFSVMPELSYGYGLDRKYVRMNKFDYAWPEFAQLGMDAIYNRELVCPMVDLSQCIDQTFAPADAMDMYAVPFNVFGYQGRYFDYKSKQDEIHGDLLDTMDVYTFARKFSKYGTSDDNTYPALNYQFVHCHPRLDMFVVDSAGSPIFWFDIHHAQACERSLPVPSMTV